MTWLIIVGMPVVLVVVHYTVDAPEMKEQKNMQQQREAEYIKTNNITITAKYEYKSEYYTNDINWTKGVSVKYIVDGQNKKIHIFDRVGARIEIPFTEVIGCEVFSDSKTVGGIKRAIVGGMLAGDAGALVGTMTAQPHIFSYKIIIYRSDIQYPTAEIVLIREKTSTKSKDYTSAVEFSQKVLASIKAIIHTAGVCE